jgi:ribosomal protein S18 acetylase RimI-like enzyme
MPHLSNITIRTELRPGDIGYVIHRQGVLYNQEYSYGIGFESYVAAGLDEFYHNYDPKTNRVWICEDNNKIIGFLLLMDRGDAAQLRYFYLEPEYRGIGLGKKLMELYMEFFQQCGFKSSYLWTTKELDAASALYTRYGFRLVEEKPGDGFGKSVIEQRYELIV